MTFPLAKPPVLHNVNILLHTIGLLLSPRSMALLAVCPRALSSFISMTHFVRQVDQCNSVKFSLLVLDSLSVAAVTAPIQSPPSHLLFRVARRCPSLSLAAQPGFAFARLVPSLFLQDIDFHIHTIDHVLIVPSTEIASFVFRLPSKHGQVKSHLCFSFDVEDPY